MRSVRLPRAAELFAIGVATVLAAAGISVVPSRSSQPTVQSFTASPTSLTGAGGTITLTGRLKHGSTCTFSVTPHLEGLPATRGCSSGSVRLTVKVPANASAAKRSYAFRLSVKGPGGKGAVTKRISEAAKPLSGVASVVGQGQSYCARLTSGRVDCWGDNGTGELGNGTTKDSDRPSAVKAVSGSGLLSSVASVVAGPFGYGDSYCAVVSSGEVDCWGYNGDGQLGNGTTKNTDRPTVVKDVKGSGPLTGVKQLAAELYGFCALTSSGAVDCWGLNDNGELGNGSYLDSHVPAAVEGVGGAGTLSGVKSLVGEVSSMCALVASGAVDCWGYGSNDQLGNGVPFGGSPFPTAVEGIGGKGTLSGVTSLTGNNDNGTNICAGLSSGRVVCWGEDTWGELGNGTTGILMDSPFPVAVKGVGGTGTLSGVARVIGVPGLSNCAILKSSALDCWGYNGDSALGNGSSNLFSNVPTKVVGIGGKGALTHVVNLVTSDASVCALVAGGLYCWGMASFGYSPSPKAVKGFGGSGVLKGVRSAAGDEDGSNCVVLTSGDAECWGANIVGQLGDGTTVGSYVPQEVVGAG